MSRLPADAPPAEGRKAISFARRPGGDLVTVSADGKTVTFPDNVVITRP